MKLVLINPRNRVSLYGDYLWEPLALGYVSLIGAVLVMPMSLLTAPLGVRVAHAMSKKTLERSYGAYLLIVGTRFAISLWNGG